MWNKKEMLIKFSVLINQKNTFYFKQRGYCPICNQDTTFISNDAWLRDSLQCVHCGSIPRQRALMTILETIQPDWKNLTIHESSPGESAITYKIKNECKGYIASQYYPSYKTGDIINEFRNENLEEQTFSDESFDIVITQDVLEHIYNPKKAFSEIARTLKQGGIHIFTVPIINKFNKSEVWAIPGKNGEPVFLKTPEWHGNPINRKGSPVTMHWGFDIVEFIHTYSGLDTKIEYLYDLQQGIWAEYIEVFVSTKNKRL